MIRKNNRKVIIYLLALVVAMFGFGFALVPIYDAMCKTLGINGKTGGPSVNTAAVDESRTVTVLFIANNNANLPWKFYPMIKKIILHPGQNARISYFAENETNHVMTVQAIPSVSPGIAAKYLKKTECFCFNRQTLKSKQSMEMPLLFHLDPNLPKNMNTVILSYTLFDVTNIKTNVAESKKGKIQS
jgi:cytochrome c oxidase assembly protein subunit 11